jgi:hypothetical protein
LAFAPLTLDRGRGSRLLADELVVVPLLGAENALGPVGGAGWAAGAELIGAAGAIVVTFGPTFSV